MRFAMTATESKLCAPARAIRLPQVCSLVGMSKATIWRRVHDDPAFPKPFKLSRGVTVWREDAVFAWLEAKQRAVA
jgi:predicted DNA-binding transcriptional regulator AlpA